MRIGVIRQIASDSDVAADVEGFTPENMPHGEILHQTMVKDMDEKGVLAKGYDKMVWHVPHPVLANSKINAEGLINNQYYMKW